MRRRTVVIGGAVATAAALAGVSIGFRQSRQGSAGEKAAASADVWSLSFSSVDGLAMPMERLRGKALLLNFWAPWCAPCATEMPLLDAFARTGPSRGWNVLALALDAADPVRRFLVERSLSLPVALAEADGLDLSRSLGNTVGALPFTVAFSASGQPIQRKLGALDASLIERWVSAST